MQSLKSVLILIWIILAVVFFGTATVVVAAFTQGGNWPHRVARAWARSVLWFSGARPIS